ncbi:MAG: glycosyltransferase [Armatimonadetes bacterium]|nr:glycosyltransferase [Armatimonadota bacterium]MBS1725863.1 glycosyltransferase family 2 protein [Armatimonadota bacterium]
MPPIITVVVVSFNTKDQLRKCLAALDSARHQVIVVDNASHDGSPDMVEQEFPTVELIRSPENLGFGRANNLGVDHAKGDLVLFLNSDAYAQGDAIDILALAFDDKKVVAAGGRLLNPDGSLQESIAGPLTLWNVFLEQTFLDALARRAGRGYWRTRQLPADRISTVDQVMGACLMIRKSCQERFDERFFLYCEDTELCERLKRHGQIVYIPTAEFIHELGSSSAKNRWLSVARYNAGKELFFEIHRGKATSIICWLLNRKGAFLRLIAGTLTAFTAGGRQKAAIFWRVLFARRDQVNPVRKPQ